VSLSFYRPTQGFFERAHPVTKIVALVLAFVPPFFCRGPLDAMPYFGVLFLAALLAGGGTNLKRVGFIMAILFLMSTVLWALFQRGVGPSGSPGILGVTSEGLLYGMAVGLRLNCFVLAAVIFLTCTRIEDFTYGLSRLGVPFVISFTLSLAFRLTPLFMETGQTIVMAQRARGLDLDTGGLIARLRRYAPIIVPILVSGLRRADQLAVALESKGFGNRARRTVLSDYPVTWRDLVLLLGVLAAIFLCAWNRSAGRG
jgi:energy-coupling factor transport system permease protein